MKDLVQFIEACETGTDRSTFYNTSTQQEETIDGLHKRILDFDRELYCLCEALSAANDYNKLLIARNLLFQTGYVERAEGRREYMRLGKNADLAKRYGDTDWEGDWIDLENRIIIERVWDEIPIPRLLREWAKWREQHLNNNRSKRLILEYLLGNRRLPVWAMKYRPNLRRVLSHAWDDATTRRIRKAAGAYVQGAKVDEGKEDLERGVFRFCTKDDKTRSIVCECICFIFGDLNDSFTNPHFNQYVEALSDPEKLVGLPYDIAIGLRNKRYKGFPVRRLLEAQTTQRQMSKKQQVKVQRSAREQGVQVRMDLASQSLVEILKYGYKMGFDEEVRSAIANRLEIDAADCPVRLGHVAVVIDTSESMYGSADRKLHPIAVALSIGLVIEKISDRCDVIRTGSDTAEFPLPSGDTDLASAVLEAYKASPDLITLITDGYENVTAGTVSDMLQSLKNIGVTIPMIQLNPVLASEAGKTGGIRRVAETVFSTGIKGSESLGAMYEKFGVLWASESDYHIPSLKKYLLGRINVREIPQSIKETLVSADTLSMRAPEYLPERTDQGAH